jgi:hypothetical protein
MSVTFPYLCCHLLVEVLRRADPFNEILQIVNMQKSETLKTGDFELHCYTGRKLKTKTSIALKNIYFKMFLTLFCFLWDPG